ncbi:MAG: lysylphosphatidylglycerol synthase transmembrane domain-containing protein [Candidatus Hodarchaeales archaeon]
MNLRSYLTIFATFFVLFIFILFITPDKIFTALLDIPMEFFLIAVLLFTFDIFLRAVRWNILLDIQGIKNISLKSLLAPMFSSSLINLVTPARAGDAVRLYALKKNNNIRYSVGLSVILVEQIITLFTLLIVGLGALLLIIAAGISATSNGSFLTELQKILVDLLPIITFVYIIGTIAVIVLIFIDARKFIRIMNFFPVPEKIALKGEDFLNTFGEGAKGLRQNPIHLFFAIAVSSSIWIIEGIMIWLFSIALIHKSFEFEIALIASVMGNITFILPLLPGAVGTYEALVSSFIILSEFYQNQDALIIALVDRGVKTATLLVLGGYASMVLQTQRLKRKEILVEAKIDEKKE